MVLLLATMVIMTSICNGQSLSEREFTNGLPKGHPVGMFNCEQDTSNGTLNFNSDVSNVSLHLTVLGCDFKLSNVPYTVQPSEEGLDYLLVNCTGTTLQEQVDKCGQPQKIVPGDFGGMIYIHVPDSPETLSILSATGWWGAACVKRN